MIHQFLTHHCLLNSLYCLCVCLFKCTRKCIFAVLFSSLLFPPFLFSSLSSSSLLFSSLLFTSLHLSSLPSSTHLHYTQLNCNLLFKHSYIISLLTRCLLSPFLIFNYHYPSYSPISLFFPPVLCIFSP